ncbi:MAG: glutamate formimidoyltransferase [Calditrichia bacterium]
MQLIECVPNISDGQNENLLKQIVHAVQQIPQILLIRYEMGFSVNRSVISIVGTPPAIFNAAITVAQLAIGNIDMRKQHGTHPRIGALDVCPFIPLHNATMQDCIDLSHKFAQRIASDFNIPVFLYAEATTEKRRLAAIRRGGYERLISEQQPKPDYGPTRIPSSSGATIVGARNVMLAFNLNLSSKDSAIASEIAGILRETGRLVKDANRNRVRQPGKFKHLQALGWYVDEFKCAQISTNILNTKSVSLAAVYREAQQLAKSFGTRITGCEVVGLIEKDMLVKTGLDFNPNLQMSEEEAIEKAIEQLNLNDVASFIPEEKILDLNRLKKLM